MWFYDQKLPFHNRPLFSRLDAPLTKMYWNLLPFEKKIKYWLWLKTVNSDTNWNAVSHHSCFVQSLVHKWCGMALVIVASQPFWVFTRKAATKAQITGCDDKPMLSRTVEIPANSEIGFSIFCMCHLQFLNILLNTMTNTFTPQEQTNEFSISAVCSKSKV